MSLNKFERYFPTLLVIAALGAGYWMGTRKDAAPPAPLSKSGATTPEASTTSASTTTNTTSSAPTTPDKFQAEPTPVFDICRAENAQEVWYRAGPDFDPQIDTRNYYWNTRDGRTLLIRQQRRSDSREPAILITANWFNKNDGSETLPKELITESKFLPLAPLIEFAGDAWLSQVPDPMKPTLVEEVFWLDKPGESVTQRNKIAVALDLTTKDGKHVVCPMGEPCRCLPK